MKTKMTFSQLVDILGMLTKTLFHREVDWESVGCETAQEILKGDKTRFATEFVKFLANGGRVVGDLVETVAKTVNFIAHTFTVLVDENQSVEELVKACGFNWSNDNVVSKNLPQPANGQKLKKEIVIFHFDKNMSSEAVIAEMDRAGYKPATIWDLLGLAKKEPNLQKEFPIVALSFVCQLNGYPYLYVYSGARELGLDYFDDVWSDFYRFAGVRK